MSKHLHTWVLEDYRGFTIIFPLIIEQNLGGGGVLLSSDYENKYQQKIVHLTEFNKI